jgi:hypothetical protein
MSKAERVIFFNGKKKESGKSVKRDHRPLRLPSGQALGAPWSGDRECEPSHRSSTWLREFQLFFLSAFDAPDRLL